MSGGCGWRRWCRRGDAGGVAADAEAEFVAESFEGVDAGLGAVAEAEVFAFVELDDVEFAAGYLREVRADIVASSSVKGRTRMASMPVAARSSSFCAQRGDERRAVGRRTRAGWGSKVMARERWPSGACARDDLGDDPLVAAVDAVEVADGGDGRRAVRS